MLRGSLSRLEFFDGLRGMLALCIFGLHLDNFLSKAPMLPTAYLAVDTFFMMSGYLIARSFEPMLRAGLSVRAFMAIRLRRLYPMFALGLAISFLIDMSARLSSGAPEAELLDAITGFLRSLLGIPDLSGGYLYPINPVFWSLTFEVLANLVHAAILVRLSTPVLAIVAGLSAVALAWSSFAFTGLDVGYTAEGFGGGLARIVFAYTVGIVLARLPHLQPNVLTFRAALAPTALLGAALLVAPDGAARAAFDWAIVVVLMPVVLAFGAAARVPERLHEPLRFAGRLSYPLYALHAPVLLTSHAAFLVLCADHPDAATIAAGLTAVATLAVAAFAARFEPARSLRSRGRPSSERAPA